MFLNQRCGEEMISPWVVVSIIFYVHRYLGKIPILTNIFSDGLKPPTRSPVSPWKFDAIRFLASQPTPHQHTHAHPEIMV